MDSNSLEAYRENRDVPKELEEAFDGRDTTPLTTDMLVKYQYIARMPTVATNYRYIVYNDGRLYYAINSSAANDPIYNVPLPEEPTRVLPSVALAEIKKRIEDVDFFNLPGYLSEPARDGAIAIVTARQNEEIHEVWYENVSDELTEFLHSITPEEQEEPTPEEEMEFLQRIFDEQED